jgi:hypothetical protein
MSTPTLPREPEGLRTRTIWFIAGATVALVLAMTAVAWLLVKPPGDARAATSTSSLQHDLFDTASGGTDARAAAARALERYQWIDRGAGIVRIPIERAIDAVSLDPALIGAPEGVATP